MTHSHASQIPTPASRWSVLTVCVLALVMAVSGATMPVAIAAAGVGQLAVPARCELPESTVIRRDRNAVLERWELPASDVWFSATVPESPGYATYRTAIRAAGADQIRPIADPPQPKDDAERELWRREAANEELMYSGGGQVRPIRCLEAALFARQHARYSQLTHPTEFVAHILRRGERLKIYLYGSDQMFPPRASYGGDEVRVDVAAGWQFLALLHNHPVSTLKGKPALGVPAPSTSDVQLARFLAMQLGLREAWITKGIYTGVVPAENLSRFSTRE